MTEITLALALLLSLGFLIAKLGQFFKLPSVTGYILAGLVLGPSGLGLITEEILGERLDHFSQLALMLIAFGIGEHMEIKRLRPMARSVGLIGFFETFGSFLLVGLGSFFLASLTSVGPANWTQTDQITLALLLGAVSVATAPAATLHVMRELRAAGPLTATLMAVVAVDDGLAIIFFSTAVSLAHQIVGSGSGSFLGAITSSFIEIIFSLLIGLATGILIDLIVHRLKRTGEMLTVGLALLLLCGETARSLGFSPLLAGMAAGFAVVNRDRRDVRIFRAINDFEPPIYVLFFTLAGASLHLAALAVAGWLGLVYFLFRAMGKMTGAFFGAWLSKSAKTVRRYLGLGLIPQAGVAIGLIFLIRSDAELSIYASIITPVVLAGVVLSELVGPVCARTAVERGGEAAKPSTIRRPKESEKSDSENVQLVPWTWERLTCPDQPNGVILFGASNRITVAALARLSAILAYHYQAQPLALRVLPRETEEETEREFSSELFNLAQEEVSNLGLTLDQEVMHGCGVAEGIIEKARKEGARTIVLGHPLKGTPQAFQRVVDSVAKDSPCQVIVVRFSGVLHTEHILVPVIEGDDLHKLGDVVRALSGVGFHQITLLRILASGSGKREINEARQELSEWSQSECLSPPVRIEVKVPEARLETIVRASARCDLIVMAATQYRRISRLFFGSLAEDVAQRCNKPMLLVHGAPK
jgi:Kef-type K+ transport system membrane component KefB/nucleotide-binding universal stress UspA family protein